MIDLQSNSENNQCWENNEKSSKGDGRNISVFEYLTGWKEETRE